jgi:hypothetical protein
MLISLSRGVGDLGTTASEVEKALETSFNLASRWSCVLLLDEADVFLAERSRLEFTRNGLVSGTFESCLYFYVVWRLAYL